MKFRAIALATVAITLSGCVTPPMGPTIPVTPAANKPFAAFQQEDMACQDYANRTVAGGAEAANNKSVSEAIIGTALGAGLGAAVGGGRGAAIGAASGAVVGTAVGSNTSAHAQYSLQQRYNIAYAQCMSSKGNQVQWGPGGYRRGYYPPPPPGYYPPPPPGYYPPPPPGSYPPPPPPPAQ
jgi:hypothetical protein